MERSSAGAATAAAGLPAGTPGYCSTLKAPTRAVEVNTATAARSPLRRVWRQPRHHARRRSVAVWGANAAGIGGRRDAIAPATPQLLAASTDARAVAAGEFLFGAIDTAGTIHTWGLNSEGALGRPTAQLNAVPGPVAVASAGKPLAVGKGYMLALTRDGALYAWGNNAAGQLGLGHLKSVATPQPVRLRCEDPSDRRRRHAYAGGHDATARCWPGAAITMGNSDATDARLLDRADAGRAARTRTSRRRRHALLACARRSGQVYAWGWNGHGQLGLERHAQTAVRRRALPGLERVRSIAAGETHAVH